MDLAFRVVSSLPQGIGELARIATSEGFEMVRRLVDDYALGVNTFSRQGECLCAVLSEGQVIAVGGVNVDPYYDLPSLGRIRHFYVRPDFRRSGVGGRLLDLMESQSKAYFESFQLFTASTTAAAFYEALDYVPVQGRWKVSHSKQIGAWYAPPSR